MLESLQIKNFRCFDDHALPFRERTIIVGQNNAGKSTIVEALRLISWATERFQTTNYQQAPPGLVEWKASKGITISKELTSDLSSDWTFHRLGPPPAHMIANFSDSSRIEVYIGSRGSAYAEIYDPSGHLVKDKGRARSVPIPQLRTLPQVSPLARSETRLEPDRVRGFSSSRLAPLHFRNQLCLFPEFYSDFKELAESTWHGLQIIELIRPPIGNREDPILLHVRDGDFVGEVGVMGHGLQMWLQTVWFLARTPEDSLVVLDEPDVYLHADLQHKLIRLLRARPSQVIVATHSIEILSESEPEEVLVVTRSKSRSEFLSSQPGVQDVVEQLGGVQNLQITRLWASGRCLVVEGDDIPILSYLHETLFPRSTISLSTLTSVSIGGWSGWQRAIGSATVLMKNSPNKGMVVYCILDPDYRLDETLDARRKEASPAGINLHIWSKKELENYLIVPAAILRIIEEGRRGGTSPSIEVVHEALLNACESLKTDAFDTMSDEYHQTNKSHTVGKGNEYARARIEANWHNLESKTSIVGGKKLVTAMSKWSQENFGVGFNSRRLARKLIRAELAPEVVSVLTAIEERKPFE